MDDSVATPPDARVDDFFFLPPSPIICDDSTRGTLENRPDNTGSSLTGALVKHSPQYWPNDSRPPPKRGPIYKVSVEILLGIFQLLAPSHTRKSVHTLSKLTHVCRFWRLALINKPRVWATIFVTKDDRRSFVEMCLERSIPMPLEVTMEASEWGRYLPLCTCDRDRRRRFLPNETNPCEWHFVFEILAGPRHSKRINMLKILFGDVHVPFLERAELVLGSCRFFALPSLQLTSLEWENRGTLYANHLFFVPPFSANLRSLSFEGPWHRQLTQVNNLTALTLGIDSGEVRAETFRTLMLNNQSLETLSLKKMSFEGSPSGPPVRLSNLKSFSIGCCPKNLSTLVCIPALQRLSSLYISCTGDDDEEDWFTFLATGDGIAFTVESYPSEITEVWEDLTRYARPTIRHIRLHNHPGFINFDEDECGMIIPFFMDAHTLEIGHPYIIHFYTGFLEDLKRLGPQLKTIRFELQEETEPFEESEEYDNWDGRLLDVIEELVTYRFIQGRPFSSVERMVVSESERTRRQLDYVWRCFYDRLERFVRPE